MSAADATAIWAMVVSIGVGVSGVIFGIMMFRRAGAANEHAKRSARASENSASEAKRSADIAERSEIRQTERNDVRWSYEWDPQRLLLSFKNDGVDDAHDVLLALGLNHAACNIDVGHLPSLTTYSVDLAQTFDAAQGAATNRPVRRKRLLLDGAPTLKVPPRVAVEGSIKWRSQHGALQSWQFDEFSVRSD